MGRFIDDENFLALFDDVDLAETLPVGTIKILLHGVPTADVQPVVHAHWIIEPWGTNWRHSCSNPKCNHYECHAYEDYRGSNYCPCCGAKMDEKV